MRLWAVLLVVAASPAAADDYLSFQSPTGNIHCMIADWDGDVSARCDMIEYTPSHSGPPKGCELDWGGTFGLNTRGKAYLNCVGDTIIDPGSPVLAYGDAVSLGGISCVSAKTGMTCTNAAGHGFTLSKAKQRIY
jgi:hypothetical protein